ncbi:MAG: DctP family TRAP transporter solute-binding subunit [bacterium]|nr:DctP family TRAP transporter solute-binding subunit [bacterium]
MRSFLAICLCVPFLLLAACDAPDTKSQITFSHILSEQSEWHTGAAKWKELVEEAFPGEFAIRLVTRASLSNNNQRTELEMVQAGTLTASWESSILLTYSDPRWTVWSMPWLFDSYETAESLCTSELGQEMLDSLEPFGLVGLAYGFNGFRHVTNNRRPVSTLDEIKNLKIRVPSLQMFISLYRLWGADPSQMNFGDLIVALREGTMDGQENPLHVIRSSGVYELQKHITLWHYAFDPIIFCMNKTKWDQFNPAQQDGLRQAAQEAAAVQRRTVVENEAEHRVFLEAQGVQITEPSPEAILQFRQASQPIYEEYKALIGADLLTRFTTAANWTTPPHP